MQKNLFIIICFLTNLLVAQSFQPISYLDEVSYERIVVKLKNIDQNNLRLKTSISFEDNDTLDSIADSLNTQKYPLFTIPFPLADSNNTELNATKELKKYISIDLDESVTQEEIKKAINRIKKLDNIDIVYAEPKVIDIEQNLTFALPLANTSTPNLIQYQGYLNSAPNGIDAIYAWTQIGGDGENVKIIDVENSWNRDHEDLPNFFAQVGMPDGSTSEGGQQHGTSVVGIMVSQDNEFGIKGIAYNAMIGTSGSVGGMSKAIYEAANELSEGGIMLIENQNFGPDNHAYVAMEYWTSFFDVIKYATEKGVTVIEAGGNGFSNLDDNVYGNAFDRNNRDSGAILVAASKSTIRKPIWFTNYGSRIDVHAWGENVATLAGGDLYNGGNKHKKYRKDFGGTSSATPIVAGAAASLQGIAKATLNRFLTPEEVRDILSSTATPQSGEFDKRIAGLPNLKNAIANLPAPETIPTKPSDIILSDVSYNTVTLKWSDNSNAEQGYRIYKGSTLIATLPANVTSYTINNLTENTSYTYSIKAFNSAGESSPLTVTFKTEKNLAWMIPAIHYPIILAP